jgi:hypothetical protein
MQAVESRYRILLLPAQLHKAAGWVTEVPRRSKLTRRKGQRCAPRAAPVLIFASAMVAAVGRGWPRIAGAAVSEEGA